MGESGQSFFHEPRATYSRRTAPLAEVESRQRADDDIVFGQTTVAQFGSIEQRAARDDWPDQKPGARTRQ